MLLHPSVGRPAVSRFYLGLAVRPMVVPASLFAALLGCAPHLASDDPQFERENGLAPLFGEDCARADDDTYLLVYPRDVDRSGLSSADDLSLVKRMGGQVKDSYFPELPIVAVSLPEWAVPELRKSTGLSFVSRNCTYQGQAASLMPWGIDRIDQKSLPLDQVYQMPATGKGVNVYLLDSGINKDHQQFGGRVNLLYTSLTDSRGANDCTGHGTLTASVIAGIDYGVAKEATLYSVRIADCNDATDDMGIADGIRQAIKHHKAQQDVGKIQRGVINLSFATPAGGMTVAHTAVQEAVVAELVVVGAAGNFGGDACKHFPGGKPSLMGMVKDSNVLLAGLVNEQDTAIKSMTVDGDTLKFDDGTCVDVYAPGTQIPGAVHYNSSGSSVGTGTSLAAAHVTGVVALYLERFPKDTVQQTRDKVIRRSFSNVQGMPAAADPRLLSNDILATPRALFLNMPANGRPVMPKGEFLKFTQFVTPSIPTSKSVTLASDLGGLGQIAVDDRVLIQCSDIDTNGMPFGQLRRFDRSFHTNCLTGIIPTPPASTGSMMARGQAQGCTFLMWDECGESIGATRLFLNVK